MSPIAKWLTILVFTVLAAAFVADTAIVLWEYPQKLWLPILSFHSQNFIFFPTVGIVALLAFWRAGAVVMDAYWRYIKLGRLILVIGFAATLGSAWYISDMFGKSPDRSWWEIAPAALEADAGDPAGCRPPNCERAPIIDAHLAVGAESRTPDGLSRYQHPCGASRSTIFRPEETLRTYCLANGKPNVTIAECCAARGAFKDAMIAIQKNNPSQTYVAHRWLEPFKIFFLLVLLCIGIMLLRRRKTLERFYPDHMDNIERSVPVGGLLMLLWPVMNQAFTSSWDVLFGTDTQGAYRIMAPLYTLGFGVWAMILVFFYFRRYPETLEYVAKAAGIGAAVLSVLKYDAILTWLTKYLGAGADFVSLSIFAVAVIVLAYEVMAKWDHDSDQEAEEAAADRLRAAHAARKGPKED